MNKKGFAFLDLIVSLMILSFLIIIFYNFQIYFKKINIEIDEKLYFFRIINNKIIEIKNDEIWDNFIDEIIETNNTIIHISYSYHIENNIEILNVTFTLNNNTHKIFILERSIYVK